MTEPKQPEWKPAETVTEVDQKTRELAVHLFRIGGKLATHVGDVTALKRRVDQLQAEQKKLSKGAGKAAATKSAATGKAAEDSEGDQEKQPLTAPQMCWRDLDQDVATEAWARLIDWVDWFIDRYDLGEELPDCWPQHAALVEELTALLLVWTAVYVDGTASWDGPVRWHDQLHKAKVRWRDWDRADCRTKVGHHEYTQVISWNDKWMAAAEEVAREDIAGRPEAQAADEEADGADADGSGVEGAQ